MQPSGYLGAEIIRIYQQKQNEQNLHLFQQVSRYAHLVSGGKTTVAKMFVNNANGQRGLVCMRRGV